MKKSPIILILIFNFLFVFGCNSDDNNERPSDDSGMSDIRGDGGFGKDADVVQDSASDQETEKDSSPDIAEDTTLNSSVEIEADLTIPYNRAMSFAETFNVSVRLYRYF